MMGFRGRVGEDRVCRGGGGSGGSCGSEVGTAIIVEEDGVGLGMLLRFLARFFSKKVRTKNKGEKNLGFTKVKKILNEKEI